MKLEEQLENKRDQETHDMALQCRAWNTEAEKLWALHRALTLNEKSETA